LKILQLFRGFQLRLDVGTSAMLDVQLEFETNK
jgi:hypothetical protein